MAKKMSKNAGVSLIEVVVAMLLIALALFTVASVFPYMAFHHGRSIHEADKARDIAKEVLDGLQRFSAVRDSAGAGATCCFSICHPSFNPDGWTDFKTNWNGSVSDPPVTYSAAWVADCTPAATGANFATATVTVNWTKLGKTHNMSVTGVIAVPATPAP